MLNRKFTFLLFSLAVLFAVPAQAQYRIYWGDMHGHTAISDGKGSLDDYFTHARDVAKLDFVVVSDHDFGNAAPWKMPQETWTLTQDKVDQYTENAKFIAVAGYEWTSQSKYWTPEEPLFEGPVKFYNHKNVYFPERVDYLFSAKEPAYNSPNLLAQAVQAVGGLIQNNHLILGAEGKDQFDYDPIYASVMVNTEMWPDTMQYQGKEYTGNTETILQEFLRNGGKTGFVGSTDTHEGKPAAKTAVLATELTRPAIFDALRHRRNYAVLNARIVLDFKINDHFMGEEIEVAGNPRIEVNVWGTDKIQEVVLVRDGAVIHTLSPSAQNVRFECVDCAFTGNSYYYVRVIQADKDEHGNPSHAWSSPIWVKTK
ncbi:MAG: CehA/McbA family metallohydrolase [Pirellulaceae bacterium]